MKNIILIVVIVIILNINYSSQNPKNDNKNVNAHNQGQGGNQNKKHQNDEADSAELISRFDSSEEIGANGETKKNNKHNKKDKKNDSSSSSSEEDDDDKTPPIHHGKNKKNKNKKPPPSERTLKWKPKKPKDHPQPHQGFSGYRPHGWGKGGNAYNDRGEKEQRKSQKKYEQYMRQIFGDADYDENDILTPEDLNGREIAQPGEYPHAVAIGIEIDPLEKMIEWKCGGSLISEQFVLTAAHCTGFGGDPPTHCEIGDIYLTKIERNTKPQRIRIAEIFSHPDYAQASYYYDIALLKLRRPAKFTKFVRPVRLWSSDEIPYETVFAMGYGATIFGHAATNVLTHFNFTLIGNEECNKTFPPIPETEYGIIDSQVCAMDRIGTKDTCQGDSGGPLQLNLPGRKRPRYSLIGVTSYGLFCGSRTPSVYTRIYSYLDWLESLVWPEETPIQPAI